MEKIYRYYRNVQHDIDSLANSYLWASKLSDFNDPFEGSDYNNIDFSCYSKLTNSEAITIWKNIHKEKKHSMIKTEKVLLKYFIDEPDGYNIKADIEDAARRMIITQCNYANKHYYVSFVKDGDNKTALENKLMWSHYSDGLRGYVIEFSIENLSRSIRENNSNFGRFFNIHYHDNISFDFSKFHATKDFNYNSERFVFRKTIDWNYENELRLMSTEQKVKYSPNSINKIIIGERMGDCQRVTLITILKGIFPNEWGKKLYESYIDKKTLKILIRPYEV
ncbi:DUF2971 domain-containing protein [Photobacterium carnosum]|uniref:DUF2971 domain-containing protein n=1 Tax=Photobacterium carnosum TaxID=2023717 RepID=UPI001E5F032D|nr:DUF2971 domain-containing protein [Photobacterium carnosum]MCD9546783.1 DUF2971 domain-containing protein [Photobacterium carnosum]